MRPSCGRRRSEISRKDIQSSHNFQARGDRGLLGLRDHPQQFQRAVAPDPHAHAGFLRLEMQVRGKGRDLGNQVADQLDHRPVVGQRLEPFDVAVGNGVCVSLHRLQRAKCGADGRWRCNRNSDLATQIIGDGGRDAVGVGIRKCQRQNAILISGRHELEALHEVGCQAKRRRERRINIGKCDQWQIKEVGHRAKQPILIHQTDQ